MQRCFRPLKLAKFLIWTTERYKNKIQDEKKYMFLYTLFVYVFILKSYWRRLYVLSSLHGKLNPDYKCISKALKPQPILRLLLEHNTLVLKGLTNHCSIHVDYSIHEPHWFQAHVCIIAIMLSTTSIYHNELLKCWVTEW